MPHAITIGDEHALSGGAAKDHLNKSCRKRSPPSRTKSKRTAARVSFDIGQAKGGVRLYHLYLTQDVWFAYVFIDCIVRSKR
jgi:hypothetical protein